MVSGSASAQSLSLGGPIQGGSTVYRNRPPVAVGVTFQSLQSVSIRLDPRIYHRMTDESRKSRMMNDEAILNSVTVVS